MYKKRTYTKLFWMKTNWILTIRWERKRRFKTVIGASGL